VTFLTLSHRIVLVRFTHIVATLAGKFGDFRPFQFKQGIARGFFVLSPLKQLNRNELTPDAFSETTVPEASGSVSVLSVSELGEAMVNTPVPLAFEFSAILDILYPLDNDNATTGFNRNTVARAYR